jgi:hypothetical protein
VGDACGNKAASIAPPKKKRRYLKKGKSAKVITKKLKSKKLEPFQTRS